MIRSQVSQSSSLWFLRVWHMESWLDCLQFMGCMPLPFHLHLVFAAGLSPFAGWGSDTTFAAAVAEAKSQPKEAREARGAHDSGGEGDQHHQGRSRETRLHCTLPQVPHDP